MGQETNLKNLSVDQIRALKKERVDFMKNQLEDLRVQDEYTRLKANIAENTLREEMSRMKHASLKMPSEPETNTAPTKKKKP